MRNTPARSPALKGIFGELARYAAITIIAVTGVAASAAMAASQNLAAPQAAPMKPTKAQLAIKSPAVNACPAQAKMAGWIMTSKPGKISYMIAKKGGGVSGPYEAEAVKSAAGAMASFSRNLTIHQAIDAEYRILVASPYGNVMSNWAPLRASCKIKLGG